MTIYRLRAYTYLLIVALIWGFAGPVIKLVLRDLPWDLFLAYRFLISSLVALPFVLRGQMKVLKKFGLFVLIFIYAVASTSAGLGFLFAGTAKTTLVSMSLITLFGPVLTILAGYFILKDRITWLEKIGIAITFLGSFLIIIEPAIKYNRIQGELGGNLLILLHLTLVTISAIILKKLLRRGVSPVFLANISFIIGLLTLIPVSLQLRPFAQNIAILTDLSLPYHAGVWYMALLSGTLAYSLSNIAQKSIEVSELAVFGYLYPIISAILAVLLLKESVTPMSYFGGGMALVGIFIAEVKRKRKREID